MYSYDLDLDQRRDWLELFPLLDTRRPDAYGALVREPAIDPGSSAPDAGTSAPEAGAKRP